MEHVLLGPKPDILLAHETEIIKAGVGKGGGEKPLNINEVCLSTMYTKTRYRFSYTIYNV